MRFFVKWGMWGALIGGVPIVCLVVYLFEGGVAACLLSILSGHLMLVLSDILGQRHYALCDGVSDINTLNKKLAEGADLNATGACNARPLIETIYKTDDVNLIREMIQKGAKVNIEGQHGTPLGVALWNHKYDIAELLINSGAVVTDSGIKNRIEMLNEMIRYETDYHDDVLQYEISGFAKTFKLFVKCNINLENFWKYFNKALDLKLMLMEKYPKILKYVDDNPQKDTELINLLMDNLLKDNKYLEE